MTEEHLSYPIRHWVTCIDAYITPTDEHEWLPCPRCNLRPKIWTFDNGRSTACGCAENQYQHWAVHAESIGSVAKRTNGSTLEYDFAALKNNWNHYCSTGEIIFERPKGGRSDGRW